MDTVLTYAVVILYALASLGLMLYGGHCYLMTYLFLRRQRQSRRQIQQEVEGYNRGRAAAAYPFVTVQLPIYNEMDVAPRLFQSATELDYPLDRFEVQIVDDSDDETRSVIDSAAERMRRAGLSVSVVRRSNRREFKAGALARATRLARGEFLAIFDADFVIPRWFLKRAIALIDPKPHVACVQGRWGHINRDENWLTRAQSVGIDGHFAAEQGARSYNNLCMNFNGTAGMWRKAAIEAAGGWQGNTLTEDLDLSYRVQLAGYTIRFDFDLECQAELPSNIIALKSQQRRWAKGSIETAVKLMPSIIRSDRLTRLQKAEAFLHLTHYVVSILMFSLCVLTLPMLLLVPMPHGAAILGILWTMIIVSAVAPCVMYTCSGYVLRRGAFSLCHFPAMLVTGTGLCLNNARAVVEALMGRRSDFIRTPKSGSTNERRQPGRYRVNVDLWSGVLEVALGIYCLITLDVYLRSQKWLFGFFIAAYGAGLLTFGMLTLRSGMESLRQAFSPSRS
jgi:cellulose synthase/poly-beta-1,6-N-acetylglucosamine synthase-like glycosyltransferase